MEKNFFATLISTLGRFNRANKKNLSYKLLIRALLSQLAAPLNPYSYPSQGKRAKRNS